MPNTQTTNSYVLCINDGGYPESLEVRKVYVVLPDERAAARHYLRVIDETGEDYLYPAKHFVPIQVPPEAVAVMPTGTTTRNLRTREIDRLVYQLYELTDDETRDYGKRAAPNEVRYNRFRGKVMSNLVSENVAQLHAREQRWLVEHQAEYAGQWVALLGDSLLTHGTDARQVYREARQKAAASDDAAVPLVVLIEAEPDLPFGGW